jgi:predicted metal-dependent peptidase
LEYEADDIDDVQNQNASEQVIQSQEEQLFEEFAKAVLDVQNKRDELPSGISRFFSIEKDSKIDWRDELRLALERFHKDDYAQMPPNKKFLHLGIYLPSTVSQRFKFVIAVDSSGSVNEKLLSEFLSELNFLMNTISSYEITLLVCDDKIRSHKVFYSGDVLEASIEGGGATDFRPVFEFIENELEDTKLLLYFSDLDGSFPINEPKYDVKWVAPKELDVPFGKVIILQD